MKFSESWLREFVNPAKSTKELAHQLTMAGLEVGDVSPAADEFEGVVIGQVVSCDRHPDAEKLSVCEVDIGSDTVANIVCGAPNVRTGLTVAVAKVGARLPGNLKIRKAKLRGVVSEGMICSARELGMGEEHDGILELNLDSVPGQDFREVLALDDHVIELELTPNRGDCLGLYGVAREVATLNEESFTAPQATPVAAVVDDQINIHLDAPEDCALYVGRVVRNISKDVKTPIWMTERLRRAGLRAIHPVVDITNFVMLESGKPMHGFDLATMKGDVRVRKARNKEKLTLLDDREVELDEDILVIADDNGARALAGIMGGIDSGVSDDTTDVFFESAYFDPLAIAGKARRFGLHTDASHRFERGVDPGLCTDSIERATQLLLEICGGEPGPVTIAEKSAHLPAHQPINLAQKRLERLVGRSYDKHQVTQILERLGMDVAVTDSGWEATPPPWRFDLAIPEDLIEEVARVVGYDEVMEAPAIAEMTMTAATESQTSLNRVRDSLVSRGYQEAITYSFVDPELQKTLHPELEALPLSNPISSDLSVMRTSLLPGLLTALKKNQSRQKNRIKLFESGLRFVLQNDEITQENVIGIIATGPVYPEQWGAETVATGFFDLKGDVEALLALGGRSREISFVAEQNPALHPAQSARVMVNHDAIGWIGVLHPQIVTDLEVDGPVVYCELETQPALAAQVPTFRPLSRYPEVRRDLAFVVAEEVTVKQILTHVRNAAPAFLKDLRLFDIYRGKGIEAGTKSIALGLILQDSSRTLTDVDADGAIDAITTSLKQNLQAKIRD